MSRSGRRAPRRPAGQRGTTPRRTGGGRPKGLGGDRVEGRHAVRELLLAGTRRVQEVVLAAGMDPAPVLDEIIDLADEAKVPIREIARTKFDAQAHTEAPQGVLATAAPVREWTLDELIETPSGQAPFLLVLDGVTDPGNLGAILRTAECAGVTGVVLPRHRSARLAPSVTKAAAGAIEHLRIATATGTPTAVARLIDANVWTVGLDIAARQSLFGLQLATEPVALVLGAEGRGLSRLVRERCDVVVTIPLRGNLESLNVATAAALACYEVTRHRLG